MQGRRGPNERQDSRERGSGRALRVVAGRNGGRFPGMHIAGSGTVPIMIPAWLLMLPGLYGVKTGESWRLL